MTLTKMQKLLLAVNVAVVLGFGWYFLQALNYEFVAYAGTIAVVTLLLFGTLRWSRFSNGIILGVTVWGILHMLGGSVMTSDGVLYAWRIIPIFDGGGEFFILKFDQVVHAYLYGVVGLMFYHLLREVVGIKTHTVFIATTAIFAAAGFSIINEIVEFLAVVNIPETGVGGYYNTVLDMIFNLAGATVAVLGALWFRSRS
jgi:putative membrane protein